MGQLTTPLTESVSKGKKRKKADVEDPSVEKLEIDINAPEPASRKALRRAKRTKTTSTVNGDRLVNTEHTEAKTEEEVFGQKPASSRSPHGIWIGNLPFFVTKNDLQAFLTGETEDAIPPDQITRIHLPPGTPKPGSRFQNKGFAYIDFSSADIVEKALQLSEHLVGGRRVLIKTSKDFQGRPEPTSTTSKSSTLTSKRIFVGNLGFDVTQDDLTNHLETCGPISNVHMATFEDSGKCKGYAWIEFEQQSSAEAAIRGWVEISDAPTGAEKENAPADTKQSKRTKKRVWVNKMGGRKLRMEFAEDKTTRYRKRFGKESLSAGAENSNPDDDGDQHAAINQTDAREVGDEESAKGKLRSSDRLAKAKPSRPEKALSGYSATSVQKLTGAITAGQGTKITFD